MQYPFRHKEHTIYPNTFLQNILVEWVYAPSNNSIDLSAINIFLNDTFQLTLTSPEVVFPILISSKDNSVNLYLGNEAFKLRFNVNAYKGFASLRTFLESGEKFLDLIRVEELQKLSIRKINMWPYKNLTGNNTAKEVLLRKIFSSDLLEGISLSSSEDIAQIFWNKDFNNDKEGLQEKVSIKFGFISKNKNEATNNLPPNIIILDTTIERTDTEKNTVIDTLTQMNQTLFDAYHWCVNQNIIHLMEGKEA